MFDYSFHSENFTASAGSARATVGGSTGFWVAKRILDILFSLLLLPILIAFALILLLINPIWNRGSLFFIQDRMGKDCLPFRAIKFRTMEPIDAIQRGHDDPIEHDRITRLGRLLRKSRIDELPQILNVLIGDMSLIGPRPDYFVHAETYTQIIPGYRERHAIRPGISGLAQVHLGYVECSEGTKSKTLADLYYIRNAGYGLDAKIFLRTIYTVIARAGI